MTERAASVRRGSSIIAVPARSSLRNVALVYIGYSFRFVSPLLLYPLLTRRLGGDAFGVYVTAYSMALMLSVLVEYGFNLSGTRDIAVTADLRERGRIAGRVVAARLALVPVAIIAGMGLSALNPALEGYFLASALAVALGCLQGSTAFWYFQGVGKVLIAVVLEMGGQIAALAAVFFFVSTANDLEMALLLQVLAFGLASLGGVALMFREIPIQRPGLEDVVQTLRGGFPIFLGRSAAMLYTTASVFLVAGLAGPLQAAIFGAAERVVAAFSALLRPLGAVLLPRLSVLVVENAERGAKLAGFTLAGIGALFLVIAIVTVMGAHWFMPMLFGSEFSEAATTMQVLACALPLIALNTILGSQVMVALRLDADIMKVLLLGGAFNLGLAWFLVEYWGSLGMSYARLFTEAAIFAAFILLTAYKFRQNRDDRQL